MSFIPHGKLYKNKTQKHCNCILFGFSIHYMAHSGIFKKTQLVLQKKKNPLYSYVDRKIKSHGSWKTEMKKNVNAVAVREGVVNFWQYVSFRRVY